MIEIIDSYLASYGLITVLVLMVFNGFMSTPPSELTIALAGVWSSSGGATLLEVVIAAVLGNIIGAYILYYIGRKYGAGWIHELKLKKFKFKAINKLISFLPNQHNLAIYTDVFLFSGWIWVGILRCLPVVRSIVSLPAGISKMPHKIFMFYSLIGMTVWAIIWSSIGKYFYETYLGQKEQFTNASLIIASVVLFSLYMYLKTVSKKLMTSNITRE